MKMDFAAAWPVVTNDDGGIRHAGPSDKCFYCRVAVGKPHEHDCPTVTKRVEMRVRLVLPSGDVFTGLWQFSETHSWNIGMSEFHKNDSSWCATNFMNEREAGSVKWDAEDPWPRLVAICDSDDVCLCSCFSFEFVRVVDDTPRRSQC